MTQPLILTAWIDAASFQRLDGLRRAHFPPERNMIAAHITLFHHLPGTEQHDIAATLQAHCASTSSFDIEIAGLRSLGRGVALTLQSPALADVRSALAHAWQHWLTPQDRQGFRPHVTVQNKVTPQEARDLLERLSADFTPSSIRAEGLSLWRYLGGPWEKIALFPFTNSRGSVPSCSTDAGAGMRSVLT